MSNILNDLFLIVCICVQVCARECWYARTIARMGECNGGKEGKEVKIKYSKETLPKWNGLGKLSSGTKKLGKQ